MSFFIRRILFRLCHAVLLNATRKLHPCRPTAELFLSSFHSMKAEIANANDENMFIHNYEKMI